MTGTVFVEAPARLHFGVLDLRGSLGRWFGGIGAAAPEPTLLVSATPASQLEVTGEDAERAATFARQFLAYHRIDGGAHLCVQRALPAHSGLGSGTQLALGVARALAELHGAPTAAPDLAAAVGRARRSAIGTWTFAGGGLVVEGGRRREGKGPAPLLARLPFPASWRCIVAIPRGHAGISGTEETAAFSRLPAPPEREVEKVSHLVLMALLPSLVEHDLAQFGSALTTIQQITGRWFEAVQGGTFTPGPSADLIRAMTEWGVPGVGQSSWGPAVYGIVDGDEAAAQLVSTLRGQLGTAGHVYQGAFRTEGARVWFVSK